MFILSLFLACAVSVEEATDFCYASCGTQQDGCDSLDMEGCHDLCNWAVGTIEDDPKCLKLAAARWECDQNMQWECSDETDIVGEPIEKLCQKELEAFEDGGCAQSDE